MNFTAFDQDRYREITPIRPNITDDPLFEDPPDDKEENEEFDTPIEVFNSLGWVRWFIIIVVLALMLFPITTKYYEKIKKVVLEKLDKII